MRESGEERERKEKQDKGDRRLAKCGFQSIAFLRSASNMFRALTLVFTTFGKRLL